ncbi:hypothetical protein GNI_023770 [Gregarina niphandrodes]|uniref:Uncharacterized protein n=1 Tax=Gregarina niphandrodes TaxID=110365 RepID=A0A023BBJ0_GRENI|nr:hypothetical protein GNI_023770 [Gregarina niphandrodes]EZG79917.1 hypothetical protein GNI_023770 [Gregarina niphandrodes]|eukprot:XP_011134362.1 hypothetical protein GNI_023770 [Gregarina niphandrodes]
MESVKAAKMVYLGVWFDPRTGGPGVCKTAETRSQESSKCDESSQSTDEDSEKSEPEENGFQDDFDLMKISSASPEELNAIIDRLEVREQWKRVPAVFMARLKSMLKVTELELAAAVSRNGKEAINDWLLGLVLLEEEIRAHLPEAQLPAMPAIRMLPRHTLRLKQFNRKRWLIFRKP